MEVSLNPRAPEVTLKVQETLRNIENIEDCVLILQLSYHETSTLFYLEKVKLINFDEYYLEITQTNGSACYLNYNYILEYCIVPKDDLLDFGADYA